MSKRISRTEADGEHVGDLLSAYIDKMLDKSERERVREHLKACADCRVDYFELRATKQVLINLPTVPPPRAFTLTQEMVSYKPGFWQRLLAPRNSPRFALGSALSFTLLVFLLIGNLVTGAGMTTSNTFSRISAALEPPMAPPSGNADTIPNNPAYSNSTNSPQTSGSYAGAQAFPTSLSSGAILTNGVSVSAPPDGATGANVHVGSETTASGVPAMESTMESTPDPIALAQSSSSNLAPPTPDSQTTPQAGIVSRFENHAQTSNDSAPRITTKAAAPANDANAHTSSISSPSPLVIVEAAVTILAIVLAAGAFLARRY